MITKIHRLTFTVTPDVAASLKRAKKEMFHNYSEAVIIRKLIEAGLRSVDTKEKQS